jgi:methionyl-tRNA synthetase
MGHPLPKHLVVHGFWTNHGDKISKSIAGSLVDPTPYIEAYGSDSLRYFLLREMVLGQDADFSNERFKVRYSDELMNLGNNVQRILSMLQKYNDGVVPVYTDADVTPEEADLRSDKYVDDYIKAVEEYAPHRALQAVEDLVKATDGYIQKTQPFKLDKNDLSKIKRRDVIMAHLVESIRRLSILIDPALPQTSLKIRKQLNWSLTHGKLSTARFGQTLAGHKTSAPEHLFQKWDDIKGP